MWDAAPQKAIGLVGGGETGATFVTPAANGDFFIVFSAFSDIASGHQVAVLVFLK